MDISTQSLPQSRIKCSVKISAEERAKAESQALATLGKRVNIKGFRPGKAPPDMVRTNVDEDDLLKETARVFLPEAIRKSMEESKAAPILPPQVSVESQEPLTLSIVYVLKPPVSLKKYDRISVEKKEIAAVEQKDIDAFLQHALGSHIKPSQDGSKPALPEITAEFLESSLGMKKSPDEFFTDIKNMLIQQRKGEEHRRQEEEFFTKVREVTTVDLATELVNAEVQEMLEDLESRLKKEGVTMNEWIKAMKKEPQELIKMMEENATKQLTLRLGLEELMNVKKISVDEEQFKKIIADSKAAAAKNETMDAEEFEPDGSAYRQIEWDLKMRKLMDEYVG